MSNPSDEIQDIIETLQVVKFFRTAYSSGPEGAERVGQVLRLLKNKDGSQPNLRSDVADAVAKRWGYDVAPRTDPTGRLVV